MPREVTPEVRAAAELVVALCERKESFTQHAAMTLVGSCNLMARHILDADARGDDSLPITEEWLESVADGVEHERLSSTYTFKTSYDWSLNVVYLREYRVVEWLIDGSHRVKTPKNRRQLRDLLAALGATTASADAERGERWRSL